MWPNTIVLSEPGIDDDLGLFGGVEPFGVQDFSAQCAVEALVVAVLRSLRSKISDHKELCIRYRDEIP